MNAANIHASCVRLGRAGTAWGAPADAGVLILGESGAGKSTLALRLIGAGAALVADDRCEIYLRGQSLLCRPPAALAGLIEARGIGLARLDFVEEAEIGLVVELVRAEKVPRMPEPCSWRPPEALALFQAAWPALVRLCPFDAAAPEKVALAAAAAPISANGVSP